MAHKPFFSVIMPVYNVEKYLDDAINSIMNQTFGDFELILVDDGSTDSSGLIAQKYKERDVRIRLIGQANAGLSAARNKGLEHANGSYIYFIDSDDMLEKTAFQYIYELLSKYHKPEVLAFSALPFIDYNSEVHESEKVLQFYQDVYERSYLSDRLYTGIELYREMTRKQNFVPNVCLFVIKAGFLGKIKLKFVDGIIYEDEVFSRYLFINANNIYFTNKKLYQRRIRDNSIMRSDITRQKANSLITVSEEIFSLYKSKNIQELKDDALRLYERAAVFYELYFSTDIALVERLIFSNLFFYNQNRKKLLKQYLKLKFPIAYKIYHFLKTF